MHHNVPQVSKEEAHLFEEQNVIDVGIVNEDIPDLDGTSQAHISSPGRLLHRSRRSSNAADSPPSITFSNENLESQFDTIDDENISDADEMSIATTVSSLSADGSANNDNNEILSAYPELNFEMSDQQDFVTEINDWFIMNDLAKLDKVKLIFQNSLQIDSFINLTDEEQIRIMGQLARELAQNLKERNFQQLLRLLICFNYIAMGCFDEIIDEDHQKTCIYKNLSKMVTNRELCQTVIKTLRSVHQEILHFNPLSSTSNLLELSTISFYSMTLFYFILTFILSADSQLYISIEDKDDLIQWVHESQILVELMKAVDSWRWLTGEDPNTLQFKLKQTLKIRNIIILISKLILVEFGGSERSKLAKKFLNTKYQADKGNESTEYKVSPLDYYYYKEDLKMRYPSFIPPSSSLSKQVESNLEDASSTADRSTPFSNNSVAESLINEPFSQRRAAAMNNIGQTPPDVHMATPAPSPNLTPVTFDNANASLQQDKIFDAKDTKKIFQNTPSYPYLYPTASPVEDAPESIKEATQIFFNSVKEDVNTKQFMNVFEDFIVQERGVLNSIKDDTKVAFTYDEDDIREYPQYKDEITSLIKVEEFYRNSLSYFNSLVKVLLQTVESSSVTKEKMKNFSAAQEKDMTREETSKFSFESRPEDLSPAMKQKYEIARVKEISLKYSSQILHQLLKWFKLSHLLKFEFFSMIIFDNNYYQTCLDFISTNLEESAIHLNNHNEFMLENLNIDDQDLLAQKFHNDELAFLKYQYYSGSNYNKFIKKEFQIPEYLFFKKSLQLSSHPEKVTDDERAREEEIELFKKQDDLLKNQSHKKQLAHYYGINNPKIIIYNWKYCFIVTNLLNVLYYTMNNNKTQRVNQLIEKKPTDILKLCLRLHNKFYYRPILKIIKLIIPFNGRKWKSNNMDSISMVYLYYKVGLRDDWLTKSYNNANLDIGEELKRSYKQEYSLRSLLQYYNIKYYEKEMSKLGYEYCEMDYFNKELEILSRLYLSSQEGNNEG